MKYKYEQNICSGCDKEQQIYKKLDKYMQEIWRFDADRNILKIKNDEYKKQFEIECVVFFTNNGYFIDMLCKKHFKEQYENILNGFKL